VEKGEARYNQGTNAVLTFGFLTFSLPLISSDMLARLRMAHTHPVSGMIFSHLAS